MKIGNLTLNGVAALAPMAGATDRPFREICCAFGAAYCVTEMVSTRALQYNYKKTEELITLGEKEHPVAIQLFGDDPQIFASAAQRAAQAGPDAIDINMGCPVPKIAGNNCGSALMKNPPLCGDIVRAVKAAVDLPVTVKIRKGWDENSVNAAEVAKYCEEAGADAICVHGRTRAQMYAGKADLDGIAEVVRAVGIPVVGNGDVTDAASAARMYAHTGCAAVMVGRGALGNPWVFRELACARAGEPFVPPTKAEKKAVVRAHLTRLVETKGAWALPESRKHLAWYTKGLPGSAAFRSRINRVASLAEIYALLDEIFA